MNKILMDALDRSRSTKMNKDILNGVSSLLLDKLPEKFDATCRGIFNSGDGALKYISMERIPPEEVVKIYYTKRPNSVNQGYDIAASNLVLYRLKFTFFGREIERLINLIYLGKHNKLNLAGAKRLVNPVIMDKSISPSKDAVFIRILRQSITVYRSATPNRRGLIKSSKVLKFVEGDWKLEYDISVLHSKILSKTDTDNMGKKVTHIEPTILHYLLAEYGFKETMELVLVPGVKLLSPKEAKNLSDTLYYKYRSAGMPPPRRMVGFEYKEPLEVLCIPRHQDDDEDYINNIAITWFYIMDGFPNYDVDDVEDIEIWKLLLGQIYRGNLEPGRIKATMDNHILSMRQHIDEYTADKLKGEFGDTIGLDLENRGFFSILVVILKNFKKWTLASESISSTTIGKNFEIEYYLLQNIIHGMNNLILQIKKKDPQGLGDFKTIKTLVDKQILPRTIFNMRGFKEITSTIEYTGDNMIFKVLPIVDLQLNTKATSKSKAVGRQRVIVNDPTSRLHKDMPIAGTMAVIKGKKLSPYYTLNPYCDFDAASRCIKYSKEDEKHVAKLKEILDRDQTRSKEEIPVEFLTNRT